MYDTSLIITELAKPYCVSESEHQRIMLSLQTNGIAVLRNFMPTADVKATYAEAAAATSRDFTYGLASNFRISCEITDATLEFRHPFLVSDGANRVVTTPDLQKLIADYIGEQPIIHHALFQRSHPRTMPAVDWHVDCGSNKALNGSTQYTDRRLRSILYLTDVESGGLGYICDTANDATPLFLSLPRGTLYPQDKVPTEEDRRISCHEKAGTLLLFDTFGLHRPHPLKDERMVLNVWYARRDFAGKLPPILFSCARIPTDQLPYAGVFANERGHDPAALSASQPNMQPTAQGLKGFVKRTLGR